MKILKVILENPYKSFKGDAKLLKGRADALSERGQEVSILYFRISFGVTYRKDYYIREGIHAICMNVSLMKIIIGIGRLWRYRRMPAQCLSSYVLRECLRDEIVDLFSEYDVIHFYHVRTIGLFALVDKEQRVVADLIDSYTYNISSRISKCNRISRLFWEVEYKKIKNVERNLWTYLDGLDAAALTVGSVDLEYIRHTEKYVVPLGVDLRKGEMSRKIGKAVAGEIGSTSFVFFGNLDYAPNSRAVEVILEAHRRLLMRHKGSNDKTSARVSITIAGRQASLGLRMRCWIKRLELVSPVDNMMNLVQKHDVAVIPVFTGSGMQSKLLESISWGLPVIASRRVAATIGLVSNDEYIDLDCEEDLARVIEIVSEGTYDLQDMADKALVRIMELSWRSTVELLLRIYRKEARLAEANNQKLR